MDPREDVKPCQCPEDSKEILPKEMYLAAKNGHIKKIRRYLVQGHDINACDEDSCCLLASACIAGRVEVVRFLHRIPSLHRNIPDWSGDTPLMHAARMGHKNVVEELLVRPHPCCLDLHVVNKYRDTALNIATARNNADIVKLIQETKLPVLQCYPGLVDTLVPLRALTAEAAFECCVCLLEYNTKERRPRSLSCGHSLCTACITQMLSNGRLTCAICRSVHLHRIAAATDVPVNFAVDEVLQQQLQSP